VCQCFDRYTIYQDNKRRNFDRMASIVARRTFDKSEIMAVLTQPDILATISENNHQDFEIDVNKTGFIACDVDDELAAVFIFDKVGAVVYDVHAHVLPAQRLNSKDIGNAILNHFLKSVPTAEKLTALIPECYPNVIRYAMQFGFRLEGVNRLSYLRHGVLLNQAYLGATREEVLNELY